jgi:hypothetical protein
MRENLLYRRHGYSQAPFSPLRMGLDMGEFSVVMYLPGGYEKASSNKRRDQHLARGELRRIIELETLLALYGRDKIDEIDAHLPLIDLICQRCR